ncbi:MAG TPA: Lrp/AsnC family transcriptional regulator [Gallionellaceae bacterium]
MNDLELHVLNDYQRDFPLVSAPYLAIARALGVSEDKVLQTLRNLQTTGAVSRVGAIFRPHRIGHSALAAMSVPQQRLEEVAQLVNQRLEVNHNYEREHAYNLWFVVTAENEPGVLQVLHELEVQSRCRALYLPMLEDYHIDLGFSLTAVASKPACRAPSCKQSAAPLALNDADRGLIAALQDGLTPVSRPYAALAKAAGMREEAVLARLQDFLDNDVIKRFGVVVRHHELGFRANAMVVWDIPDEQVAQLGQCMGEAEGVTLCYRRPRRLPEWRYNMFSMIHGRDRDSVCQLIEKLRVACGLMQFDYDILFSKRRFKQQGAHYVSRARAVA